MEMSLIDVYRKSRAFWRKHGTRALVNRIRSEFTRKAEKTTLPFVLPFALPFAQREPNGKSVGQLIQTRFEGLTPLPTYLIPAAPRLRVSIVTDSIGRGSLFGGVGTALIFATLLANKLGADLRVITRTERPQPDNLDQLLLVYGIELKGESQFQFLPPGDSGQSIDFSENELFITTSWWTTVATLASVPASSILYLLQEDERMFYPFGDDRLKCENVLRHREIRILINTQLLFDHFTSQGFSNIQEQGWWFEPAFPARVFRPRAIQKNDKRKFVFYARPNNLRNLFYLGIEVINAAIAQQVLSLDEWEIILVGKDIPDLVFDGACVPTKRENMSWSEYADLAGTIDLGLSLMYTPHPSYPPLDLVASGAVVVTNRFANKQSLSHYSANLICAEPERDALVDAIRQGVALAKNQLVREENFRRNGLCADWNQSFAEIIQRLPGKR